LARIEAGAFQHTRLLSVVVSENVSFVARNAFPRDCVVRGQQRRCEIQWRSTARESSWSETSVAKDDVKSKCDYIPDPGKLINLTDRIKSGVSNEHQ
jgi:hypothetical protein